VKLTAYLHVVLRLRMHGDVPLLFFPLCMLFGQVRDNFAFFAFTWEKIRMDWNWMGHQL
jgi:hypothetical protein